MYALSKRAILGLYFEVRPTSCRYSSQNTAFVKTLNVNEYKRYKLVFILKCEYILLLVTVHISHQRLRGITGPLPGPREPFNRHNVDLAPGATKEPREVFIQKKTHWVCDKTLGKSTEQK